MSKPCLSHTLALCHLKISEPCVLLQRKRARCRLLHERKHLAEWAPALLHHSSSYIPAHTPCPQTVFSYSASSSTAFNLHHTFHLISNYPISQPSCPLACALLAKPWRPSNSCGAGWMPAALQLWFSPSPFQGLFSGDKLFLTAVPCLY